MLKNERNTEDLEESNCPVTIAVSIIGGKWKPPILSRLVEGVRRFGELQRLVPHITKKMLTQQLRELEQDGIVQRKVFHQVPPKVEYSLSEYGESLKPVLRAMEDWGRQHRSKDRKDKETISTE